LETHEGSCFLWTLNFAVSVQMFWRFVTNQVEVYRLLRRFCCLTVRVSEFTLMTESESCQTSIHCTRIHGITIQKNRLRSEHRDNRKWNPNVTNFVSKYLAKKVNKATSSSTQVDKQRMQTCAHTDLSHNDTQNEIDLRSLGNDCP
jgi:hypothetical protein